ncbi:elongation factor P maturation arginine rhamnosyltransferase EarP [Methylobacillus flagellatus]|uniref:elongation factor P maturation arginine rhamnosyltransferase EarP n=1 Tax=Methylobacillus flagellatus TaxID=405 RepID=UPI0028695C97|nr:elongation factor P maturation arginine rhamnosyltransferase EarP [Methylobacillus flagellatus]
MRQTRLTEAMRWDIFCSIVDNYGDIGVCWRLARQLAHEHGIKVRLWIDRPQIAAKLVQGLDPALASQEISGVEIRPWTAPFPQVDVADVVIEAFGCALPEPYLRAMQDARPVWVNLEYLSAEQWVDDFHARPSPHPQLGLTKHFFFPGFSPASGGLLREGRLLEARARFQQSPALQAAFWQSLGIMPQHAYTVSLFCYPHAPVDSLLDAMAEADKPVLCIIPHGPVADQAMRWLEERENQGGLRIATVPFLPQDRYDQLLWACDLNFVRGEDSWVRALWAGKPMIWQPYLQAEDAHLAKLEAFLQRYCQDSPSDLTVHIMAAHRAWNRYGFTSSAWQALLTALPGWQRQAQNYAQACAKETGLAAKLVIYCKKFF